MKIYTVLEPPDGKPERVAFVPEGFCWAALLLTVVWALWHRMWVVAALLFAVTSLLTIATSLGVLGEGLAALLQFGVALLFGFEARTLQAMSLERAGFRRSGLVQASGLDAAEFTYFDSRRPVALAAATSRLRAAPEDTLGIFGNV